MSKRIRIYGAIFLLALLPLVVSGAIAGAKPAPPFFANLFPPNPGQFSQPAALIGYLRGNAARLSRPNADKYLMRLIELQERSLRKNEKRLFAEPLNKLLNQYAPADLNRLRVREASLLKIARAVRGDGLTFATSEGMNYLEIDFPGLNREFGGCVSPGVAAYLGMMARETEKHFAEDAGLQITLRDLSGRLVAVENFLAAYPDFSRRSEVVNLRRWYLSAYLIGMNNTPAFDYQTFRLKEAFLRNFEFVVKTYPHTGLAALTRKYLKILAAAGYRRNQRVLDFAVKAGAEI